MATVSGDSTFDAVRTRSKSDVSPAYLILKALGSLKITVAMFSFGVLLLLFGTLAQDQQNMAEVKRLYFNAWLAVVPFDVLFPITIFPHDQEISGAFPFPGGATIGLVLMFNLIAAKATRFSVFAKGTRLVAGIVISLVGAGIVTAVITSGHAADGLQGAPPISYDSLWTLLRGGLAFLTAALVVYTVLPRNWPTLAKVALWVATAVMVLMTVLVLFGGDSVRLNDPGMRIVWQLLQAGIASLVCLVGLAMIFGKRGGNVLIHAGVGLMMVGQFVFGDRQVEQRLSVAEGSSTSLVFQQDQLELAIVDPSDPEEDQVTAIPEALIRRAARSKQAIKSEELPVELKIVKWMPNSRLLPITDPAENLSTIGDIGKRFKAEAAESKGGAMEGMNIASAYVQVFPKSGGEAIGTVLLSQQFNDQAQLFIGVDGDQNERVTVDGKDYELALRFRREYKPYSVTLKDVERIDYSGTETPRDYSSTILITDKESGKTQEGKTWMNNPIRYRGETFYQSQYNKAPTQGGGTLEITGLQVVENSGWVIPYVTCMMVLVGMLSHFGGTFLTFAMRYERGAIARDALALSGSETHISSNQFNWRGHAISALIGIGVVAVVAGYFAKPASVSRTQTDWNAIAKIPMQHEGRIKPMETVARNVLQIISEPVFGSVPYVKDVDDQKRSPTEWLMGVIVDQKWAAKALVFRIYSEEVRNVFDLKPRKGFKYSYDELLPNMEKYRKELEPLRDRDPESFNPVEQKLAAMNRKLSLYDLISVSYRLPPLPDPAAMGKDENARQRFSSELMQILDMVQRIEAGHPPAVIPPVGEVDPADPASDKWQAYGPAVFATYVQRLMSVENVEPNPALMAFDKVRDAVLSEKAPEINSSVVAYNKLLEDSPAAAKRLNKASAEVWLNKFNPTGQSMMLYLVAIVLGFSAFMTRTDSIRRVTFWLLFATFLIHTIAIVSRIYISGRPPVINLYSSAVFIGWGTAMLGLILEMIFPIGICNIAVAITGVITLSVARSLDTNDTLHVLQAVLDTQFWLSTHVVTVTFGYAATYLAGIFGILALVHRMTSNVNTQYDKQFQDILYRIMYGIVCFGLFLSFIGTVLGGLWADDSWGRFWGWDPKENGALMIVLWNAIVLHARWDKQVGARGFALLAVGGNIITTWSWFGVNQLGVGLHSYGNNSSVLMVLAATVLAHLLFIAVSFFATLPPRKREAI